jgi:hypothetical protein
VALITKTSTYDRGNHRHQGFRTDGSPEDFPVSELAELASELAKLEMVMECHRSETRKQPKWLQMAAVSM